MKVLSLLIGIIIGLVLAEAVRTKEIIHGPRAKDIKNRIYYYQGHYYRLRPRTINTFSWH
jgi:uncharacterized protein YneF (UPF0154 family)